MTSSKIYTPGEPSAYNYAKKPEKGEFLVPNRFQMAKKRGENDRFPLFFLVPLTGLEPVRVLSRRILSPLRLPIPPQRRIS